MKMSSNTTTDQSLLATEMDAEDFYSQILLQAAQEMQSQAATADPGSKQIRPEPGLCVKTKCSDGGKVFVNVCQSSQVPAPPPLSEAELIQLLESDDPSSFRVPMSLGEPHAEVDNSSQGCTAYDVVINSDFFQKAKCNQLFLEFIIAVCLEGLEIKYNILLSREWKLLKNRKFLGNISEQHIRTKSKPVIQEIGSGSPQISDGNSLGEKPHLTLTVEPSVGDPQHLIAEIKLPKVSSSRSLILDLGEDRIVLSAQPALYHMDCYFPFLIDQENSQAQFYKTSKVLKIKMPVVSSVE
ncbi:PIH1 domain-containing protein 1 isoform X1 [Erpetoichthys calabaricus]|uniref:PIH1 domain-containing protein 1 isoform X1 n=1 Tax=Erpetoichthys calabaricus TaxID=27687 RepID=UPI00223419EE|nr:PIH1 domain-containing protein 1 isoform X1 [Erpetoichthys calabaricus]